MKQFRESDMYTFSSKLWFNKKAVSAVGEASLYLQVVINRKHKEFNLKLRWPVKFIDMDQGKLVARYKGDLDVNTFNVMIGLLQANHNEINRAFLLRKEILDIQKFTIQTTFFNDKESFSIYLQNERTRRFNKREIDKVTYNNAGSTLRLVLKFDPNPLFSSINKKWMSSFKVFLQNTGYKSAGEIKKYKASSIWSVIKCVKTYLHIASAEPLIFVSPDAYLFENPEPLAETEYLERDELRRLFILQDSFLLSDVETRVLKAFLFQCYTGLRISDIYRASNQWRISDDFLLFLPFKNRKNGRWLKIPLMGPAKTIVKKATDNFFNLPNKVQFNETLKTLAFKAEINKKLKSHMGRHTFGFVFMTSVGNLFALKELLGHQKIDATQRYAHLNDDYKLKSVRQMADSFSDYTI